MKLVDRLGIVDCEPRIYFLRELNGILRHLPMKVFNSPEDRLRLIEGVQVALDELIEEEDEQS